MKSQKKEPVAVEKFDLERSLQRHTGEYP